MASVQLNFTLRTTPTVKTVHLLGSWDNYQGQLPLSRDSAKKSSSGAWTGTFRFQPGSLKAGTRYWYYYIMDGYHVTHDPAREAVVEPTTQRKLNILDIPVSTKTAAAVSSTRSRHSRRESVAKGRSLSPSQIKCPRPQRPGQTKQITTESYTQASLEEIQARLGRTTLDSDDSDSDDDSDDDSDCPSLSRSSNASSPSNLSSASDSSSCTCERYGITRAGNRIKLDCGGSRCGSSDDSCGESDDEEIYHARATRRNGIVIRGH